MSITLKMRRASMHVKRLVEAVRDHGTVMELLLTRLGVRAPHVPHTSRRRLHQQKHWHEHSYSWTFFLLALRKHWHEHGRRS